MSVSVTTGGLLSGAVTVVNCLQGAGQASQVKTSNVHCDQKSVELI